MFYIHGIQGRVFSGTLEQLRQQQLVTGAARIRRIAPVATDAPAASAAAPGSSTAHSRGAQAGRAYGPAPHIRQPLTCAADVMRSPALTVPATATLREAWKVLARHAVAQAPVVGTGGVLVGLVGRAELMPADSLEPPSAVSESARLSQPVTAVMWSPVPSTAPETDLRRVAALLLHTGLPGVPVATADGEVVGFVSRTDLLRALTTDPPLDLWG
jgi:CBS domain-containing protein